MVKLEEHFLDGRWWWCLGNLAFIALFLWLGRPAKEEP